MDIVSIALAAAMLMFPVKDAMEQPVRMLTVEEAQMMVLWKKKHSGQWLGHLVL